MLDTIGNTPVVRIGKLVDETCATVLVKLEYFNPTGSYKDRMEGDHRGGRGARRPAARRMARQESTFAGTSSGMNVAAANRLARERGPGRTVVTDLKHLASDLYEA
jgi:cysteine synthase